MSAPRPLSLGWTVALSGATALAVLALLPPVVGGEVGAALHHAFGAVCHQLPERSPHLAGGPIALCHRCFGVAVGLAAGVAAAPALSASLRQRVRGSAQGRWLIVAALPTALDWSLGALGVWANTPASRGLTGAVFGLVAGAVLAVNLLHAPARGAPALYPDA